MRRSSPSGDAAASTQPGLGVWVPTDETRSASGPLARSGADPQKTDIKVSLIGGHRLKGETLHERTLTASLIGGADIDLTGIDIPDGAELRVTELSLIGGVSPKIRPDVRVELHGIRLGGVKDDGPPGPAVRRSVSTRGV